MTAKTTQKTSNRIVDRSLLIKPVFSSKASSLAGKKQHAFLFKIKAGKPEIKKIIESIYEVKVEKVNVARYEGKLKTVGRFTSKATDFKKVFVTLTKDSKDINVMPAVA